MFCHKCGEQLAEGVFFCHKCGTKIVYADHNPCSADTSATVKESGQSNMQMHFSIYLILFSRHQKLKRFLCNNSTRKGDVKK